ncbi:phospholipid scramblase, partial [Elysia marginata]
MMMQQPMMQVPPNVVMPAGLPPGLAYLAGLSEVKVHQILELAEVLVGWERNNKYDICNSQGQKFMFAKE